MQHNMITTAGGREQHDKRMITGRVSRPGVCQGWGVELVTSTQTTGMREGDDIV